METLEGMKRTHHCGELRKSDVGKEVVLCGWVSRRRDHGGLIFVDMRDRSGLVQVVYDESEMNEGTFHKAESLRSEFVIAVRGKVRGRSEDTVNPKMDTGEIEVVCAELRILNTSKTPPFYIQDGVDVDENLRLKYRYLDLRRPEMQKNIMLRHKVTMIMRNYFDKHGFLEIETPMLCKSTPEGARDFLVPSRLNAGTFYALPQSPQIYKQILMLAGYEKYFQIVRCFRDEDLRADRQPEFTQIDLEMSFVDCDDIMDMAEGFISRLMKETIGVEIQSPLPRMTFAEAMNSYGSDKPDTRFGMLIQDLNEWAGKTDFAVFKNTVDDGGSVKAIVAKNCASVYTRKKIDKLTEHAKGIGAKGLAYIRWADEVPNCSFAKFLKDGELEALLSQLDVEQGDVVFIVSDKTRKALTIMGALRLIVAKELDIIPQDKWNYLWITEMPFFELDEETGEWVAAHHPFTMPMEESIQYLDTDKSKVKAQAFDLVLNATELSSGSMRITDVELQTKMFELLGMEQEEIDAKFGFLVDAYHYAAPPHGGMGIGLDRLAMLICGADSLRDVVAFPKVQNASELMSGAPSYIDNIQLDELGIDIKASDKNE